MKAITKAALLNSAANIHELWTSLENISADDRKEICDYTVAELVAEAEYVLSTFFEAGHYNGDAYSGEFEDGEYTQKWARGEVRKLKALIKKYKTQSEKLAA
jgi:hypothetical protein